ncbi:MAG: hypothetical protein WDM70_05035 [Nitrosomonadales bacterium]
MTNLYNFMDGSDGLAGGMTFFGFTMYGLAALMHGDDTMAMLNFSIGAAALGFLYYNLYPAQVFMEMQAQFPLVSWLRPWALGVGAGGMAGLVGVGGVFSLRGGCYSYAVETFDSWSKDYRGAPGTYYQRLVQIGWGHRNVALFEYALMFASGVSAIWAMHRSTNCRGSCF